MEVSRALGWFGFYPDPDDPEPVEDPFGVLKGEETLPWQLHRPARESDGSDGRTDCQPDIECTVENGVEICRCVCR